MCMTLMPLGQPALGSCASSLQLCWAPDSVLLRSHTSLERVARCVCVTSYPSSVPPPPLPCFPLHMHHIHAMTCVVVQVLCPLSLVLLCPSTFSQASHGRRVFRALFEANPNSTSDTPMAGAPSSPQPSPATVTEQQPGQQRAHHRGRVTLDTSHQTPERAALEGHGRYCSVCKHTQTEPMMQAKTNCHTIYLLWRPCCLSFWWWLVQAFNGSSVG